MVFHHSSAKSALSVLTRYSRITIKRFATQQATKIDKTILSQLRANTGFSFYQCNQALKAVNNDVQAAEVWLKEQAEKEGWKKAAKLQTRSTNQGLVGVLSRKNYASIVNVACETDFVARNDLFRQLVTSVATSTLEFRRSVVAQNMAVNSSGSEEISHLREVLMPYKLNTLRVPELDMNIEENIVSVVGKIGENIRVKKALAISTNSSNIIGYSSHGGTGVGGMEDCALGTYGAIVVLKPLETSHDTVKLTQFARSLSQHVIGMNPKSLHEGGGVAVEESLMGQQFLLDESKLVGELVDEVGVDIVDFVRYGIDDES